MWVLLQTIIIQYYKPKPYSVSCYDNKIKRCHPEHIRFTKYKPCAERSECIREVSIYFSKV